MSILQPISNLAARARRPTSQPPVNSNDSVLRATGVLSLLAIGAIHFLQIVQTTEQTPLLGVAFMLLVVGCLAVAARLAIRGDLRTWLASAAISAAAIAGYAFTRTFSTPLDNQDAGNWSCMLGLAALFIETTLLAFSASGAVAHRALHNSVTQARTGRQLDRAVEGNSNAA
jgi:hypothetical protein